MDRHELKRAGEHVITRSRFEELPAVVRNRKPPISEQGKNPASEQALHRMLDYVSDFGLVTAFQHLFDIAQRLDQGAVVRGNTVTVLVHDALGEQLSPDKQGRMIGWETRRLIDTVIAANPKLTRSSASALFRDGDEPRSRAKNVTSPRREGTKGQSSWDRRVENIQARVQRETGRKPSFRKAHQIALQEFQERFRKDNDAA